MKLHQLQYALVVGKNGSITKSAQQLDMAQPNLSSAIKKLEKEVGVSIFKRNSKGVCVTPEGQEFLLRAQRILDQMEDLEDKYCERKSKKTNFVISLPYCGIFKSLQNDRAKEAFDEKLNVVLKENTTKKTIEEVAANEVHAGIVCYQQWQKPLLKQYLKQFQIEMHFLVKSGLYLILPNEHPLMQEESLTVDMLNDYTQVVYNCFDFDVPREGEQEQEETKNKITVNDDMSFMTVLKGVEGAYALCMEGTYDYLLPYGFSYKECNFGPEHDVCDAIIYKTYAPYSNYIKNITKKLKSIASDFS